MLYSRTIEPRTFQLLKELMSLEVLNDFYLVGGTALSLQKGHRFSVDLDLFTKTTYNKNKIIETLQSTYSSFNLTNDSGLIMFTLIDGIKVDFVKMSYPILFQPIHIEGIRMLNILDIAPMKLKAIVQRGSKKDFFDMFYILKEIRLDEIMKLYQIKFSQEEIFHVIKSLTYFDDAENDFDPLLFDNKVSWIIVKQFIVNEVINLTV
jgi:predicted nucleotidyltransferase component of viral defense system